MIVSNTPIRTMVYNSCKNIVDVNCNRLGINNDDNNNNKNNNNDNDDDGIIKPNQNIYFI